MSAIEKAENYISEFEYLEGEKHKYLRYLKHTDAVRHIDSIYRNQDT